ncbi:MAG: 5'-nucleotidase, lipoprotein e(P4) family [Bacteroidales bacterium]|nr:5'-nucleotidase, lipoprotein e(P4) family [Bacteroidales bacterium]
MKKTIYLVVGIVFLAGACSIDQSDNGIGNRHMIMSTLYHQKAAEMRALAYQAYNMAKLRLDVEKRLHDGNKKLSVVVDIDETVLDNSPYQAESVLGNISYPERWSEWCKKAEAKPVPGSLEFLTYADEQGITIFYVTNRKAELKEATIKNLKELGFPQTNAEQLMMRTGESSKEARRNTIREDHKIAVLIGDNLNDFLPIFEEQPVDKRFAITDSLRRSFGKRFIVLPNAMYGEWEGALYGYDYSLDAAEKEEARINALEGF